MRAVLTLAAAIAAAAGCAAPPAQAQTESPERSYRMMQDLARCFVRGEPTKARALLAMQPETEETKKMFQAAISRRDGCMNASGKLSMRQASFRGVVAERLYLDTYSDPPADLPVSDAPFTGSGNSRLASYDVTLCVAQRDPFGADRFVRSPLRSPEEKAALSRIIPVIAGCTPKGAQIGFDRAMLHGLLAEALFKSRSGSAAPAQAGTQ
ncbi:hypothetical protein [Sphingomonas sp. G-3-2-10]|uniref:hypothetical protein n=1 Tax=Sphingomonas sp. G-3-2-10 TaxID=2728838 RepID=UPI00146BED0F|nr:hypothetical protein [Sphingomonas sp. G-3-2-10]NML05066.1 hypothetical protein [Sphingomonas sp. G-3-2-10]